MKETIGGEGAVSGQKRGPSAARNDVCVDANRGRSAFVARPVAL